MAGVLAAQAHAHTPSLWKSQVRLASSQNGVEGDACLFAISKILAAILHHAFGNRLSLNEAAYPEI
jgi:hypothetical protein